jgi:hypothetical protein
MGAGELAIPPFAGSHPADDQNQGTPSDSQPSRERVVVEI